MVCLQIFVSDHDTEKQGQYSYCSLQPRDSTNPIVMYEYGFGMSQVLVALFSIVYASKRLQRGGTEASRRLFYTHLAYATVFIVLWTAEVSHLQDSSAECAPSRLRRVLRRRFAP